MNMSYCRFQNTATDLRDCRGALQDMRDGNTDEPLSRDERDAAMHLVSICADILELIREQAGIEEEPELADRHIEQALDALQHAAEHANDEYDLPANENQA